MFNRHDPDSMIHAAFAVMADLSGSPMPENASQTPLDASSEPLEPLTRRYHITYRFRNQRGMPHVATAVGTNQREAMASLGVDWEQVSSITIQMDRSHDTPRSDKLA